MEQFEFSLYKNCINNNGLSLPDKKIFKSNTSFDVKINSNAAFSLLSEMLSSKLEEFMVVPIENERDMETNQNQLKVKMNFDDFAKQKGDLIDSDILKEELEMLRDDTKKTNRTGYFQLYKARNITVAHIKHRTYSIKTLNKTISEVEKNFKKILYIMIIKNERGKIGTNIKKVILHKLFESYASQFLDYQSLGKTMEEGNNLVLSLQNQMHLDEMKEKFLNETFQEFNEKFYELLEIENYIVFSKRIISYLELEFKNATGIYQKLSAEYFTNFLIFILGELFSNTQDIDKLVRDAYQSVSDDLKEKTVNNVLKEYLSVGNLTFAIRAKDLSVQKKFYSQRLTKNIEVMSHSLFNAWQYEQLKEMGVVQPTIVDVPDDEKINTVWFIITGINCANKDTDLGYELAKKQLENYLEFSYYFLAREDEYNFKIIDPYICYNMETKSVNYGRKNKPFSSPKEIETFPKDLLDFSKELFESKQPLHLRTIECISLYYQMINNSDGNSQPQKLLKIWETIFNTSDIEEISGYASIIIAGTNYKKGDITYGNMRKILFEDFLEFISHIKKYRSNMLLGCVNNFV